MSLQSRFEGWQGAGISDCRWQAVPRQRTWDGECSVAELCRRSRDDEVAALRRPERTASIVLADRPTELSKLVWRHACNALYITTGSSVAHVVNADRCPVGRTHVHACPLNTAFRPLHSRHSVVDREWLEVRRQAGYYNSQVDWSRNKQAIGVWNISQG